MKNKGFTLIELLGVIIILALLMIIVFPSIINSVKNSSNKTDDLTKELIYNAADLFIDEHINDFPKMNGSKYSIDLSALIDEGLLTGPIKLSGSDQDITNNKCIQVTYNNGYQYELKESGTCKNFIRYGLPDEYQQVEYIETTGEEYIYTGFKAIGNLKVEGKVYTEVQNTEMAIVGSVDNGGVEIGYSKTYNRFFVYSNSSTGVTPTSSIYNTVLEFTAKINTGSPTKELTIHNIDGGVTQSETSSNGSFQNNELQLFKYNDSKYPFIGRLYELKFYDNNVIVRYFVPCYRKSDNVIGLYDTVTNVFYTNLGTGTFEKGKDI